MRGHLSDRCLLHQVSSVCRRRHFRGRIEEGYCYPILQSIYLDDKRPKGVERYRTRSAFESLRSAPPVDASTVCVSILSDESVARTRGAWRAGTVQTRPVQRAFREVKRELCEISAVLHPQRNRCCVSRQCLAIEHKGSLARFARFRLPLCSSQYTRDTFVSLR